MNYNNPYYNPYQQYPYTQGNNNMQYQQAYQQPQVQMQQQPQTNYLPLTFVNGIEGAKERIFATTDKAKGTLKNFSTENGYETFVVPDDVGGRFSVLTAVGLLPITGIPLPFISYGGTAMLINYLAFGVILNISMSRNT